MKKIQILNNHNKIYNEVTRSANYVNECDEFSMRIVLEGSESYRLGTKNLKIHPGNFLIINEGTVFSRDIDSDVPVNTFSILYTTQFLNAFHRDITSPDSLLLDDPFMDAMASPPVFLETLYPLKGDMRFNLAHLKDQFYSGNGDDMLMNEYLLHSLLNFYRIYNQEIIAKREQLNVLNPKTRVELFKRLSIAKDYMISNYNQTLSLEDICQHACLSETHFYRTFKQTFQCSPYQYLTQVRLSQAKYMLKNTSYEVREIVSLIGFDCPSSFTRLFRERFGITPISYRTKIAA